MHNLEDFFGKRFCLAFEDFVKYRKVTGDLDSQIRKFIKRYPIARDFDDIIKWYVEEKSKYE